MSSSLNAFLRQRLNLELHPEKSKIISLYQGINFLGLKIFPNHKTIQRKNLRRFKEKLKLLCNKYDNKLVSYDKIYDFLEGWLAYAKTADTYTLRSEIISPLEEKFCKEISTKDINRILKLQKQFMHFT